jgi:phosphatidate cytidylyltransferase
MSRVRHSSLITHNSSLVTQMKRILTAIVGLPILLFTVWSQSPYFFAAVTAIAALLALKEFYGLASNVGGKPQVVVGYIFALVVLASFLFGQPLLAVAALIALSIVSLSTALVSSNELKNSVASVSSTVFGVVYVALLPGCLIGVRMLPDAVTRLSAPHLASKLLTTFFALVMLTDTGAYYVGRSLGRHKLAPRISPGKTIEGAVGGFLVAMVTGVLCKMIFFHEIPVTHAIALGAAIGLVGQIGDLAESMLKRGAGVKDSGNLLPGHGGMLDRIDSILFCAPLLYYYAQLLASSL